MMIISPTSRNAPTETAGTIQGSCTRSGAAEGVGSGVGEGLFAGVSVYSHMAVHQALKNSSEVEPPREKTTMAMGWVV